MAGDQAPFNYDADLPDDLYYDDDYDVPPAAAATTTTTTTTVTSTVTETAETTSFNDYYHYDDDEPIEDYVVNLIIDDKQPNGATVSPSLVDATVTDMQQNMIPSKSSALTDSINQVTTAYNELSGNTTAIAGPKGWWSGKFAKKKIQKKLGQEAKKEKII